MTTDKTPTNYERLAAINVNEHIEKKGGLSYLSWPWAVDQLMRADPDAEWEFGDREVFEDGTVLVRCTVRAFDKLRSVHLPVMDYKNRAIPHPNAFEVNTAMMRCLVKAIALHGLGLYIYAGEDLPPGETAPEGEEKKDYTKHTARQAAVDEFERMSEEEQNYLRDQAITLIAMADTDANLHEYLETQKFDAEEKMALWSLLPAPVRALIKKQTQGARNANV